jgi:hypothetical protein
MPPRHEANSGAHAFIAGERDDQERLPQKQGLCQVAGAPDFEMLSDFYQATLGGETEAPTIPEPAK